MVLRDLDGVVHPPATNDETLDRDDRGGMSPESVAADRPS